MDEDADTTQLIETTIEDGCIPVASESKSLDGAVQVQQGPQGEMGCLNMHPAWMQRFATPQWFLFSLCLFTITQSMVNSGLFPVIISSIERQFGFTSTQAGYILSSYDVISAIFAVIITNYGHRAHRPLWMARGMTVLGIGCFMVTIPHWISGNYIPAGSRDTDICAGLGTGSSCSNVQYGYYALFILAQIVIAVSCSPLYTLGSTFVDDNVPPKLNSTYMGIFYSMGAVGPALGYVVGGLFLRLWVDIGHPTTLNQNSVGWVGAWWAPFLLAGSLAVVGSLALYMFPKHLPGMEWVLEERRKAKDRQLRKRKNVEVTSQPTQESFYQTLKSILSNKPYIFSQIGFTLEAVVIVGLGAFLPKVVQTQFRTTASNASFLSGAAVVFGAAGGILTGGLISRKWTMKTTSRNVFIMGFSALLTIPCFLVHCSGTNLAGLNTAYPVYNVSFHTTAAPVPATSLSATCNMGCDCRASAYKPVCGGDRVTYFSACHAGCSSRIDETTFTNCSCLSSTNVQAVDGACEGACLDVIYFLLGLFFLLFVTFMINVPGTVFCMRVVSESQRSLALGIGSAIQRVGGAIPGPIVLGAILDGSCVLWDKQCDGSDGACWEYDSWGLSRDVFIASFVLKSMSSISFFLAWHSYHPATAEEDAPEAEVEKEETTSPIEMEPMEPSDSAASNGAALESEDAEA